MSGSSEEDDYMSDAFLTKTIETDVRPGLPKSHKIARQNELDAKKARFDAENKKKPIKQLEAERREEGLSSAISSSNKGFAMLAKMGYKQGDSIGRSSSSGIVEPIPIQVKNDRGGLGREAAIRQLEQYKERLRKAKAENKADNSINSINQFRQRMAQKTSDKQLESELCKCQRACEKLDLDASIDVPAMIWFWPQRKTNEITETLEDPYDDKCEEKPEQQRTDSSSDEEDTDNEIKGRFGKFESDTDESNQSNDVDPNQKTPERISDGQSKSEPEPEPEESNSDEIEYEISDKIEMLTNYVRTTYSYCHWCGIHYKDADDMQDNCPGLTKDDH